MGKSASKQNKNNSNNDQSMSKTKSPHQYSKKPYDKSNKLLNKIASISEFTLISPHEIYLKQKYEEKNKISTDEDKCPICMCAFYMDEIKSLSIEEVSKLTEQEAYNVILLKKCSDHFFHVECLINLIGDKQSIKCPICNKVYGILIGDQPNGTMKCYVDKNLKCDGYERSTTIVIKYYFPHGTNYSGTSRVAYLPNTQEGREVLALFKIAWDRRLLFTVGTSVTTGKTNTTVWNGIHHKTNKTGGPQSFGYPDKTYFSRVKEELAAKGVNLQSLEINYEEITKIMLNE
jgi:deltex-like protein